MRWHTSIEAGVDLAPAGDVEAGAELGQLGDDLRCRVGLDGVVDAGERQAALQLAIVLLDDGEVDDEAGGLRSSVGEELMDAVGHFVLLQCAGRDAGARTIRFRGGWLRCRQSHRSRLRRRGV